MSNEDTINNESEWRWDCGQRLRFMASGRAALFIIDATGTKLAWLDGHGGPALSDDAVLSLTERHAQGPYGKGWTSLWHGVR